VGERLGEGVAGGHEGLEVGIGVGDAGYALGGGKVKLIVCMHVSKRITSGSRISPKDHATAHRRV